jgi:serine/threonine protein phosphatase PrpC
MKYVLSQVTDLGSRKKVNQDASYVGELDSCLFHSAFGIVCDGVGSCEHSEIASSRGVSAFNDWFEKCYSDFADEEDEEAFCGLLYERWFALFNVINDYIVDFAEVNKMNLGSTLSCILIRGSFYYILHIGDTRIYKITDEIIQLTPDHTLTALELSRGNITEEEALTDSRRHTLTKCLGIRKFVRPEFFTGEFSGDSKFLICSDGFRGLVDDKYIYDELSRNKPLKQNQLDKTIKSIIRYNRNLGENDNITAVVIQISEE